MLIKCKDCESEYNAQYIAIPKSGIEFECSECGKLMEEDKGVCSSVCFDASML